MLTFLARCFIPDRENTASPTVRKAYGVLCGAVGIALNLLLFAGKFLAGQLSGSIAITASTTPSATGGWSISPVLPSQR